MKILLVSHQTSAHRRSIEETLRGSGHQVEIAYSDAELAAGLGARDWDALIADVSEDRDGVLHVIEKVRDAGANRPRHVLVAGEQPSLEAETRARLPNAEVFTGFTRSDALLAALSR